MFVQSLMIYPIKSLHGISVQQAVYSHLGLKYDREWMLIDANNTVVTQREIAELALFKPRLTGEHLIVEFKDQHIQLELARPATTESLQVQIWSDTCSADLAEQRIHDWFNEMLALDANTLRLVRKSNIQPRFLDESRLPESACGSATQFADAFPFLVTVNESLLAVNAQISKNGFQPIPMSRFRSNIILSGATAPWLENHYAHLVSKALPSSNEQPHRFSLVKACERCKVVSIDQQSAVALQPKEPLKSLVQLQKKMFAPNTMPERGAYFGQNMVLTERHATGIIKVGDVFSFTS